MGGQGYVVTQGPVIIELTVSEALVLFEYISRCHEQKSLVFEDQAEQRVMWNLEGILESALAEPFRPDYDELLEVARAAVRDEDQIDTLWWEAGFHLNTDRLNSFQGH